MSLGATLGLVFATIGQTDAARSHGLDILDGVYRDLNDEEGFYAECKQGWDLGFDGKALIHPKQLEAASTVFAPSPGDIENVHKIIAAWELAKAEGNGVAVVDGKLVENLHVTEARRNLALMDAIQSMTQ